MVKFILLVVSFLYIYLINLISTKILFEDNFNKLDESKWDIINGKHDCKRIKLQ